MSETSKTGQTGSVPVEEEAGEPSHDMADRSREVEGVSDSILPAGGWENAVDQSSE